jgi:hypothetical protein
MRLGWANRMRRTMAGLVILSVVVLSLSQAFAVSSADSASLPQSSHAEFHAGLTPLGAVHDDPGLPCQHHNAPCSTECCIAGGCSIFFPWLAATDIRQPINTPSPSVYRTDVADVPDGAGAVPAIPPPRCTA